MPETSYNGWTAGIGWSVKGGQLVPLVVAGESFPPGVRKGDVHTVFEYLAQQLHARVEPIVRSDWHQADDWGYSYRPSKNSAMLLSCHASATAIDYNATRHPNGKRGTFTAAQVATIRAILRDLQGVVRWGGDFTGTPDEMHFEIRGTAAAVAKVAAAIRAERTPPPTATEDDMQINELYQWRDQQGRNLIDYQNFATAALDQFAKQVAALTGAVVALSNDPNLTLDQVKQAMVEVVQENVVTVDVAPSLRTS